jgi:hypothetical protein
MLFSNPLSPPPSLGFNATLLPCPPSPLSWPCPLQREIAQYLCPTGTLIFIWNLESSCNLFHASIRALYEPYDLGTPQYYKGWWRKGFEVPAYKELFEPPEEGTSEWALGMTEDQAS